MNVSDAYALCQKACQGRDESHGYDHSIAVVKNAWSLLDPNSVSIDDISFVAILHDVADHKYDTDGCWKGRVKSLIEEHYGRCADDVWLAIDTISYSKEAKNGMRWYESCFNDPYWLTVRNIVSDADKLEALYAIGAKRCLQYGAKAHPGATDKELIQHLNQHVLDKLSSLHKFFRTDAGRTCALEGTAELFRAVSDFTLQYLGGVPLPRT